MALGKGIYRAFEDIVGPDNVSEEPAILDAYAWTGLVQKEKNSTPSARKEASFQRFAVRCEAVLLPGGTKEVQSIVRLCNKLGLRFKAFSTGWIGGNIPSGPGAVQIDLRRMNRILEINEKNMYAVVEPYVIGAQLQAELMKVGLNCNITGGGSQTSALPIAAHWGTGHAAHSISNGERNLLALEWVSPEGDIVRTGSLGSIDEWFCGDGPGPSLRGIVRGSITPFSGMGVYTRAATKVYYWPGPSMFPIEGTSPRYWPTEIPPCFMIRYFSFPSMESRAEAMRQISESEIAFELMGFPIPMIASNMATSNQEEREIFGRLSKEVKGPGFVVIITGSSEREFSYRTKVLKQIIEATGGTSLAAMEDQETGGAQMWRFIRPTASIRETFRATGDHSGIFPGHNEFAPIVRLAGDIAKVKKELQRKDLLLDDGAEAFPWTEEYGNLSHAEVLYRFSASPASLKGVRHLNEESVRLAVKECAGIPFFVTGDELHDIFGPVASNYHVWLRRIKKAFDPNGAADSASYITAGDE